MQLYKNLQAVINIKKNTLRDFRFKCHQLLKLVKRKFAEWHISKIGKALDKGIAVDDIEIKLRLATPKPFHASWPVELCNYMSTEKAEV